MLQIKFMIYMNTSGEIAVRWMPQYTIDDGTTLVKAMAWRRQATSHNTWANVDPDLCLHMVSLDHAMNDHTSDNQNFFFYFFSINFIIDYIL